LKESSYIPSVALSASYQPVLSDMSGSWKSDNWIDNGSISLTLAWDLTNILPWSSSGQSLKSVKEGKAKLALGMRMSEENARIEIENLLDTLQKSKDQIEASDRSIALAQQSYDLMKESYDNGQAELLDLRDAENSLNQAKLTRLSNEYTYLSTLIDLEYATALDIR